MGSGGSTSGSAQPTSTTGRRSSYTRRTSYVRRNSFVAQARAQFSAQEREAFQTLLANPDFFNKYADGEQQPFARSCREEVQRCTHVYLAQPISGDEGNVFHDEFGHKVLIVQPQSDIAKDTSAALYKLAEMMRTSGKLDFPEPLYRQALAMRTKSFGEGHELVAETLHSLALLLWCKNPSSPEAVALGQRALKIAEQVLGLDHKDTMNYRQDWGNNSNVCPENWKKVFVEQMRQGDESAARATAVLAVSSGKLRAMSQVAGAPDENAAALTLEVASALHALAERLRVKSELDEAEPLYRAAYDVRLNTLGENHSIVAESLHSLALLLWSKNPSSTEAVMLGQRALKIASSVLGPEHPETLRYAEDWGSGAHAAS